MIANNIKYVDETGEISHSLTIDLEFEFYSMVEIYYFYIPFRFV